MKIPWRHIIKTVGVIAVGAASVMGAMEADENVQKVIKKVASKSLETMEKKS